MQKYLRYSSILILLVFSCKLVAQSLLPELSGKKVQYSASIEMPKAYISGICIILNDSSTYKASIFNEFGISCIELITKKSFNSFMFCIHIIIQ